MSKKLKNFIQQSQKQQNGEVNKQDESFIKNDDTYQNQNQEQNHNQSNEDQNHDNTNTNEQQNQKNFQSSNHHKNIEMFSKSKQTVSSGKSKLEIQLIELQAIIFHHIILKSQSHSQNDFQKQLIHRISERVRQSLQENISEINRTEQNLENPILNHHQKQQIKQKILELRMEELANTKVLVNTYKHHEYRLVFSFFHIARTYLDLKCYQQAINHLNAAIQINQKYKQTTQGTYKYIGDVLYLHTFLLTFLAQAQYQLQIYESSLQNLNKTLQIQQNLKKVKHNVNDFLSSNLMSLVLSASDKNWEAITSGRIAVECAEQSYGKQSLELATAYKTLAEVEFVAQKYEDSIDHIKQGIRILQLACTDKQQTIINFYQKLCQITLKKLNQDQHRQNKKHFDSYIQLIKKKYQVIQNTYGYRDKRAIKQKRHLASSYLKYMKINDAEQQLEDILQIEQTVYGQKSVQVGKTLKLLGTIAMSQNQVKKAENYLKKSQSIFHDQGHLNLQKQVQAKLLVLTGNAKFLITNKN